MPTIEKKTLVELTSSDRELLRNLGVKTLPDNPSAKGYNASEIKQHYEMPTLQLFTWLKETISKANQSVNAVWDELGSKDFVQVVDELPTTSTNGTIYAVRTNGDIAFHQYYGGSFHSMFSLKSLADRISQNEEDIEDLGDRLDTVEEYHRIDKVVFTDTNQEITGIKTLRNKLYSLSTIDADTIEVGGLDVGGQFNLKSIDNILGECDNISYRGKVLAYKDELEAAKNRIFAIEGYTQKLASNDYSDTDALSYVPSITIGSSSYGTIINQYTMPTLGEIGGKSVKFQAPFVQKTFASGGGTNNVISIYKGGYAYNWNIGSNVVCSVKKGYKYLTMVKATNISTSGVTNTNLYNGSTNLSASSSYGFVGTDYWWSLVTASDDMEVKGFWSNGANVCANTLTPTMSAIVDLTSNGDDALSATEAFAKYKALIEKLDGCNYGSKSLTGIRNTPFSTTGGFYPSTGTGFVSGAGSTALVCPLTTGHNYLAIVETEGLESGISIRTANSAWGYKAPFKKCGNYNYEIVVKNESSGNYLCFGLYGGTPSEAFTVKSMVLYDLTEFGLGTLTADEAFKALIADFDKDSAGVQSGIVSTSVSKVDSYYANLFNGVVFNGYWNGNTGEKTANSSFIGSDDYIKVSPNKTYKLFINGNPSGYRNILGYDRNKHFVSRFATPKNNETSFTTPTGVEFVTFYFSTDIANGGYCLIDGTATEAVPFRSLSKADELIFSDDKIELRGIGSYKDRIYAEKNGTTYDLKLERNIGCVDLGSLTWDLLGTNTFTSENLNSVIVLPSSNAVVGGIISCSYSSTNYNACSSEATDKTVAVDTTGKITVCDKSFTTASAFKSSVSGVALYYALKNPTTETLKTGLTLDDITLIGEKYGYALVDNTTPVLDFATITATQIEDNIGFTSLNKVNDYADNVSFDRKVVMVNGVPTYKAKARINRKVGKVNLGSLTWHVGSTSGSVDYRMVSSSVSNIIPIASGSATAIVYLNGYTATSSNGTYLRTKGVSVNSAGQIEIYDPDYNSQDKLEDFVAYITGKYLYYALNAETNEYMDDEYENWLDKLTSEEYGISDKVSKPLLTDDLANVSGSLNFVVKDWKE